MGVVVGASSFRVWEETFDITAVPGANLLIVLRVSTIDLTEMSILALLNASSLSYQLDFVSILRHNLKHVPSPIVFEASLVSLSSVFNKIFNDLVIKMLSFYVAVMIQQEFPPRKLQVN